MVTLCRDLNIETIGEMIEDKLTTNVLIKSGVTYGQGYLFGKPTMNLSKIVV